MGEAHFQHQYTISMWKINMEHENHWFVESSSDSSVPLLITTTYVTLHFLEHTERDVRHNPCDTTPPCQAGGFKVFSLDQRCLPILVSPSHSVGTSPRLRASTGPRHRSGPLVWGSVRSVRGRSGQTAKRFVPNKGEPVRVGDQAFTGL